MIVETKLDIILGGIFGEVVWGCVLFSGVNINFLFTISGVNQFSPLAPRFSGVMTQIFPAGLAALV